ncbi:MAG: hypothetical protein AVDCRST_MAG88-1379, partial [uncultured Thermomicrobiales bacterium]
GRRAGKRSVAQRASPLPAHIEQDGHLARLARPRTSRL